jgi:hypothetical protein
MSCAREHPGQRDEAWFERRITPKLEAFSLKAMGEPFTALTRTLLAHPCRREGSASTTPGSAADAGWKHPLS